MKLCFVFVQVSPFFRSNSTNVSVEHDGIRSNSFFNTTDSFLRYGTMGKLDSSFSNRSTDDRRLEKIKTSNIRFILILSDDSHLFFVPSFDSIENDHRSSRFFFVLEENSTIDFMSMSILPEIYRHTARKSTVSKNVKTNNSSTSSLSYLANHHDGQIFQVSSATKPPPISYQIQMEKHRSTERFLLLPENETEQMIIDDDVERFVHQTLDQICEQISSSTSTTDNQMKKPNDQVCR